MGFPQPSPSPGSSHCEFTRSDWLNHRITTAADARAITIAPNGSVVAYDRDVTTWALFEHGDNRRDQITSEVRKLRQPVEVNAEGDLPAQATADLFPAYDDDGGMLLILTPDK